MQKIAVIGTGYVGLVTGACLADFGLEVICFDINEEKINLLNSGKITIYEPELEMIVKRNQSTGRLQFTHDLSYSVEHASVIFIAVGTPSQHDGTPDLSYLKTAIDSIAPLIDSYKVIVAKSTVPIGSCRLIKKWFSERIDNSNHVQAKVDIISNPEFLREGSAIYDFMHPDRVIIGYESERALSIMKTVYRVLYLSETPFIVTDFETAEMIKYASNSFLALKIAYINQIANVCEKVGANIIDVSRAMGKDGRIGPKFLHPGPGFGGSCFPKDIAALSSIARNTGFPLTILDEVINANKNQKKFMIDKITNALGTLKDKKISVLGLSFKPNTDDLRESPSIYIISELLKLGARIKVFDPVAMNHAKKIFSKSLIYCENEYDAIRDTHALVITTEWNQFRNLDLEMIKSIMLSPHFFDLKNIYSRKQVEERGFCYYGVGV